jgi:hypothetical protein
MKKVIIFLFIILIYFGKGTSAIVGENNSDSNPNLSLLKPQIITPNDIKNIENKNGKINIKGKSIIVYEFGGNGNDWCFVRTPKNYDPNGKPCPFVICNHGNGEPMDGSLIKATWTPRTMYVTDDNKNYIEGRYDLTAVPKDSPLLYSNPTIEALLNAGYVVCGAENYGENLYGNDDSRNAIADFYNHMLSHYNVEKRCSMIGASNGALATLNAMYVLGGTIHIKSIILQYPLTTLWKHYSNYPPHQSQIEAAYGLRHGLTEYEFDKATATHDPEKMFNSKSKISMPPIEIWYSLGDTVVNAKNNAIPFIEVLKNNKYVYKAVLVKGEHGDVSHFNPKAYVDWFQKWR